MRILIIGAGAIGGYFGGRLLEAGRDVTFLVRPPRAEQLDRDGLIVRSPSGNIQYPAPPRVLAAELDSPYDLILLSCKAYDLDTAAEAFAPAVGAETLILPLLNGMAHIEALAARFSAANVLGGQCLISVDRDQSGAILHLNDTHLLSFGELDGSLGTRVRRVADVFANAGFEATLSDGIVQDMWEKWCFIATAAGATCAMRAAVGDILQAGGEPMVRGLYEECAAVAAHSGHALREPARQRALDMLTHVGSPMMASMLRDIERGAPIEADQVIGDLIARRGHAHLSSTGMLDRVYLHLKAYEARRSREAG